MKKAKNKLAAGVVYIGDNGMLICQHCAGETARTTGKDISGQPVFALQDDALRMFLQDSPGKQIKCECGKTTANPEITVPEVKKELGLRILGKVQRNVGNTLGECSEYLRGMIRENGFGASDIGSQFPVVDANGKGCLAVISYNGRMWSHLHDDPNRQELPASTTAADLRKLHGLMA
jgi:hypothetical protein